MKAKADPVTGLRARVPIFRSLQVQLLLVFLASFTAAALAMSVWVALSEAVFVRWEVDYFREALAMDDRVKLIAVEVNEALSEGRIDAVQQRLADASAQDGYDLLITSSAGEVVIKSRPGLEDQVDVTGLIQQSLTKRRTIPGGGSVRPILYTAFSPVTVQGETGFLLYRGMTRARTIRVTEEPPFYDRLAVFTGTFLLTFVLLTRRKLRYLEELTGELLVISRGNLQHRVAERSRDELGILARSINTMVTELESRIEAERRAERTKSDLITGVSHDLRTPLTSIKGYLDIVRSGHYENPEQVERYVEIAHAKTEQLQEMVEELFEYTKLAGQDLILQRQPVSLNRLLAQITDEYIPLFEPEGLSLTRNLPQGPITADVDPDRFVRVLDNLLGNALKYSQRPGTVTVSLRAEAEGAVIVVQNPHSGPHMSPEELENLFAPFFRLDPARTQAAGGSGLGLAIARRIAELHSGRIWAESAEGFVSFHVWLPFVA
ncbi:MAG TPA: HAMP domain-containing sensor histidine kinase [Symbiobacteriaceae bacterium]|nr:HAMP domain-containing sensor histidine kinase [Symbiobacteriaceae bacterium]